MSDRELLRWAAILVDREEAAKIGADKGRTPGSEAIAAMAARLRVLADRSSIPAGREVRISEYPDLGMTVELIIENVAEVEREAIKAALIQAGNAIRALTGKAFRVETWGES